MVGGGVYGSVCIMKTLVAIIVMLSILGQCEMSIYPGLRRKPLQQGQPTYEVNSDFLAQLMEDNARRRLQQQFEQQLELINMQIQRQRQKQERIRERFRQQQLAAMAAENDDYDFGRKFSETQNLIPQQYDQYDNTNTDFSFKYPTLSESGSMGDMKNNIDFALRPSDPRYYETDNVNENAENDIENRDNVDEVENAAAIAASGEQDVAESEKDEDLDSQVLEEYEEYNPKEEKAIGEIKDKSSKSDDESLLVLAPNQPGLQEQNTNPNFHRIKPQTQAAKAVAGLSAVNAKGVAPARQDINSLIDKLQPKKDQANSEENAGDGHVVVREHLGMKGEMGMYIVALIAGVSAAATVGLFVLGIAWYTFRNRSKAAADVDYPAYGITGPNKDISPSGDRKLAQSAQMYHYQHQKQQIIAMENRPTNDDNCEMSYVESDDDNEEGDYTVYECPGLAPTGEMEVKNPLFLDDTPVTPSLGNHPIAQVSAQQPSVKKIFEKSQSNSATANATSSEDKKSKKPKK